MGEVIVMSTPTPLELTAPSTIIVHISLLRGLGVTLGAFDMSEKESSSRKFVNAYGFIAVLGVNVRSNPHNSMDHLSILPN